MSVTRAEVCAVACAELFRDAGEIMVSPMATMVSIGARLARLTFSPDIVLTDGEARLLADTPAIGAVGRDRGLDAVRPGLRDTGLRQAPRRDGRQPDRPVRQPEPVGVRTVATPEAPDVRRPRRPGQHASTTRPATGSASTPRGCSSTRSTSSPASGGTRSTPRTRPTGSPTSSGWSPTSACSTSTGPDHTMRALSLHPGCGAPSRCAENTSFEVHGLDAAGTTRLPTEDEQKLIREVIDPKALAGQGSTG